VRTRKIIQVSGEDGLLLFLYDVIVSITLPLCNLYSDLLSKSHSGFREAFK